MRLKCRTPNGIIRVGETLTGDSLVDELRHEIESQLGFTVKLKVGFPPTELCTGESLFDVGIKDGDQIIAEKSIDRIVSGGLTISEKPTSNLDIHKEAYRVHDGYLVVRVMNDDNSCLFRSIAYAYEHDSNLWNNYRSIVAKTILDDPITYNEAFLGKKPENYVNWILLPNSWGGAIELSIFSNYLGIEIISLDVLDVKICGIHYDVIVLTPELNAPKDFDQTVFENIDLLEYLDGVKELGNLWKKKHKYTDIATFTLRCTICHNGLKGEREAQEHAQKTGHANFVEYM